MQKFHKGDHVKVAKDLGQAMSHFESDCEAIIIGSYADQYGGNNFISYTIYIKGSGEHSWYYESQLELIEANRLDLLKEWEKELQEEKKIKSNLNWIFRNGKEVLENPHGATIEALAKCLGFSNLWGDHGEGIDYYFNAMAILLVATPFLKTNDKDGWLKVCRKIKEKKED